MQAPWRQRLDTHWTLWRFSPTQSREQESGSFYDGFRLLFIGATAGPVWIQGDDSLHVQNVWPWRGEELCHGWQPPCQHINSLQHWKLSLSLCLLSSEGSSKAWPSPFWPPASSTRLPSAATAMPWITSRSPQGTVPRTASRPLPLRCSLRAASPAWCRWGCSVRRSPSAETWHAEVQGAELRFIGRFIWREFFFTLSFKVLLFC